MEKLALGIVVIIVVLIAISYGVWIIAKDIGVAPEFRIYLIGIVVIIVVIKICTSLFIESCTEYISNDTNNKEEIVIQL